MYKAKVYWERLNLIRKEKFDLILPGAMRDNGIDMWIHAIREGNFDPLAVDLGGDIGYFIFTDRGQERIERAVLGGDEGILEQLDVYDILGDANDLKKFVDERNPKKIAVNKSENLAVADGISYTEYLKLVKILGDDHKEKLVSAEQVITDFRTKRVMSEIVEYGKLCQTTQMLIERALSYEVIKPGATTLEDIGWWMEDQLLSIGLKPTFELNIPYVIHSATSEKEEHRLKEYVIQKGDLMQYDFGIDFMNLGTDMKRIVYVLRDGEKEVPKGIQHGWDQALKARKIIRKNIKVGRTAGETLTAIGNALEEAGFKYVHLDVDPMISRLPSLEPDGEERTGVTIDCHCVGNTGNSEVASGPSIAGFRQDRAHLLIKPRNIFAFEFIAVTPVPDWGGRKIRFNIEDNAIVTELGVEWLYPPNKKIMLIH